MRDHNHFQSHPTCNYTAVFLILYRYYSLPYPSLFWLDEIMCASNSITLLDCFDGEIGSVSPDCTHYADDVALECSTTIDQLDTTTKATDRSADLPATVINGKACKWDYDRVVYI